MQARTNASELKAVPYSCASIAFDSLDGVKKNPSGSSVTPCLRTAASPCVVNTSTPPGATMA